MRALIGLVLGAGVAAGILLVSASYEGRWVLPQRRRSTVSRPDQRRLLSAVAVAVGVGLVTRWPVAAIGALAIVLVWPRVFGATSAGNREVERAEALAIWTESLRDSVAGSMSLEQAIPATVDACPPALAIPLHRLVGLMGARIPLPDALLRFGDDLNDPSADLVVAALWLNAAQRGPGLSAALTELAGHARSELELRQRIEAGRQPLRRASWIVVGITLLFTAGLAVFARDYVEPYAHPAGQVALLVVLATFVASFAWARKLSEYRAPKRFLAGAAS
ncbi:hypothetical protein ASD11_14650 [Aeromicrobium sp. Root495]|uniref:type II secretion system F family protein n=1 Tax=Aeromicrobium sp. Root495 TaxID=1736550 RepID=UPI0006F4BCAB|nr:type II secretion system F family protein [Aeromicrobium sp. Root495]KQY55749.1 hypothetical protein ASD11_14650 [Aeromicrobium sp. Root495]